MRCPKCGAFMEEGKDVCFMCGINVKTYNPGMNNTNNTSFSSNDDTSGMFGSGSGNVNKNNNFGYNPSMNSDYNRKKEEYQNRFNNYRDVTPHPVKNGEKDIFDFFTEHKKVITLVFCVLVIGILAFVGNLYYKHKTKEVLVEPIMMNLYYEIDDSFKAVSGNSSSNKVYSKSGDKGNACSITITYGTGTTGDHVEEFFKNIKDTKEPEKDEDGKALNEMEIYTAQDDKTELNGATWYYLNLFYKTEVSGEPTHLKYKYFTSMYNGYFYDIELVNNSNDASCSASLDNFSKSLKFIET